MKAARIIKPKESLEIQQLDLPKPRGSQVLVKVHSSGVCHSDIHLWEGGYEGLDGQFLKASDRGVSYPLTPGHEIAGTVESLGEEAAKEAIGKNEKVIVYPWIGEGLCPACRAGEKICATNQDLWVCTRTVDMQNMYWYQVTSTWSKLEMIWTLMKLLPCHVRHLRHMEQ
jgi:propanol-preferring alcohol dehydrogenase